jgi:two-component system, OmpR family, sensor histidine kinase KdpD
MVSVDRLFEVETGAKRARAYSFAIAILLTTSITLVLWLLRDFLNHANFSLIYLLGVVIVAIWLGTGPSLLATFMSFFSFNFFLVKPLYTFLVADSRDVLDLIVFLSVAVITGQLAAYARKQADAANQRADELKILYSLTSSFNRLATQDDIYATLQAELQKYLHVKQVYALPNNGRTEAQNETTLYVLLEAGNTSYGTLCVVFLTPPTPPQVRLINGCAVQAALALQRIDLAERAQSSKSFQEADRLKTALLHAVSHDLRTPITIIKSSASNLLTLYETLPKQESIEMVRTIEEEVDALDELVGNLLDMSRLIAGAFQLNIDWNSLEEVAGDVAARAWQRTGRRRIKLEFSPDFPLVKFDYGLILQALGNLVENSLRYEPDQLLVEIRGHIAGKEVLVAVVNHGPSIPEAERAAVLEPFYHGKDGHIGLGLAIARGIVEAHKGRLWLEDTPGGGVTFLFTLPFSPIEEPVNGQGLDSR